MEFIILMYVIVPVSTHFSDLSTENDIPRERCVDDGRREIEALMTFGETEIKVGNFQIFHLVL